MTDAQQFLTSMVIPIITSRLITSSSNDNHQNSQLLATFSIIAQFVAMFLLLHIKTIYTHITTLISTSSPTNIAYVIKNKITFRHNAVMSYDISTQLQAVMHDISLKLQEPSYKHHKYQIEEIYIGDYVSQSMQFIKFDKTNTRVHVTPSIFITTNSSEDISNNNEYVTTKFIINIHSTNNDMKEITNYLTTCTDNYTLFKLTQLKHQQIFIFNSINKDTNSLEFQEIPFDTTKSFDNMFFEQKDALLDHINYFQNNHDTYKRLGIPYTFGMLFHGAPGCGKTSAIKAIAKYTQRHIIILPIKKIKTIDSLKRIFLSKELNGTYIPNDKRLYVFEEIDCGQWRDIVMNRELNKAPNNNTPPPTPKDPTKEFMNIVSKAVLKPEECPSDKEEPSLTLGELLELLDGVIEVPHRMMIFTSNHPELLDPALLRPGRIDITIDFKKMTRQDIANMYRLWFNKDLPKPIQDNMKDYAFSQAEIGMIFAKRNRQVIHDILQGKIKVL